MLAYKATRISKDPRGSDVASAHELAKGYTRSIYGLQPFLLPESVRKGQDELVAVQKLNKIVRTNAVGEKVPNIGDSVQV